MAKSAASSCFKFITCAGDSVDHDDIKAYEGKGSSGRGWSFRIRSPRHRVLSTTLISEALLSQKLQESEYASVQHEKENCEYPDGKKEIFVPSECYSGTTVTKSSGSLLKEASENDDELVTCDAINLDPNSCKSIAPPSCSHSQLQSVEASNLTYEITESYAHELRTKRNSLSSCDEWLTLEITDSAPIQTQETDQISDPIAKTLPNKEETRSDGDITDLKKYSAEQSDFEAKQFSTKASNPSFTASQSKFEERSSAGSSLKLTALSSQDPGVEYSLDNISSSTASAVQMGGSECGTELSISSSLDSPDRPGIEESEPAKESRILGSDPSYASSLLAVDSPQLQQKPEANPSGVPLKLESEATQQMENSSPAASARSCRTIPESQATPASEVSVKPKKGRGEIGVSNEKRRSSSGDKTSRITWEQKERKNGKRRYSFGSTRSYDHANQEPRDSSSGNSLPSYMLATESARAKAIINSSPRSSPGVHNKDKRLSLPGTDGRQVSFRIQRSLSQSQQKAKGNETHSLLDRKWRW